MVRAYKPAAETPPLDWDGITARITAYVRDNRDRLSKLLAIDLEDHPQDEELPFELAELQALLLQLFARHVAERTRPPNYSRTAIRQIERRPELLHERHDELDPEAVARVLGAFAGESQSAEAEVFAFEQKAGKLDADRIKRAAQVAFNQLPEKNSRGGRPVHEIQGWFAEGLARIYLRNNLRVDRIVYGLDRDAAQKLGNSPDQPDLSTLEQKAVASSSVEIGKFKDLAGEVVRFVRSTDPVLGASLIIDSIVRLAWELKRES